MKLKMRAEDFVVSERWRFELGRTGPVGLYELSKKHAGTIESVRAAAKQAGVSMKDIFFGGLKDTHAYTKQYVSITDGPARDYQGSGYALRHIGRMKGHLRRQDYLGNRFVITVRDLTDAQAERIVGRARQVERDGTPNYFDAQRFGSLRGSGKFAAKALITGDAQQALRLVLASPSAEDRSAQRRTKTLMRNHWASGRRLRRNCPDGPANGTSFSS